MEIKIKYQDGVEEIKAAHKGEWYDLRAGEDVDMVAGEYKRISLGVSIKLPEGFEAIVAPRSSTFEKFGIIQANSIGVIDNGYSGDNDVWQFGAIAMRDTHISKNDRIAQFRILYGQPETQIVKVEHLDSKGRGGFGSTGHK